MSSEDVIELGSSDEEREPPAKKKKALQNAMVRIPNPHTNLPAVTIKPTKVRTPLINKVIPEKYKLNPIRRIQTNIQNNIPKLINTKAIKHTALIGKHLGKNVKFMPPIKVMNNQLNIVSKTNLTKYPKATGSKLLKNLPSSITVKRSIDSSIINSTIIPIKKSKLVKNPTPRVIHTLEIDDELPDTSKSIPQWYKRPEEQELENKSTESKINQENKVSFEEQNNKEPTNFIEITIDDSPVKPIPTKRAGEVSNSITIEDSPVKCAEDISDALQHKEDRQSKKKLDYPQVTVARDGNGMLEIEFDPIDTGVHAATNNKEGDESLQADNESKNKKNEVSLCKKNTQEENVQNFVREPEKFVTDGEFNAVYQKFINTCFRFENSEDMKQIVEKKIKAYYRQCSKEYVDSETFTDFVSGKIIAINVSPDKMYLYIKDVVDELNMQRKLEKSDIEKNKKVETHTDSKENDTLKSEPDTKRQRQIHKLEKTLNKLNRAIQKLEEQEVDFDDEDDSVYLLTERYKDRILRVHAKLCQMTHTKLPSEPYIKLETQSGRPTGPARRLEKWINKRVPIGKPLPFPDFHDVLRCVREANDDDKIGWSEMEILEEARELFTSCGKKLKRRRQENDWRIVASRVSAHEDPAEKDDNLKKKLEENKMLAIKQEADVFNRFVDRQNQLKLNPEEMCEKETEESPSESGEDDNDENAILKDKEKRKHRLKRLLREKSKKASESDNTSKSLKIQNNNVMENLDLASEEDRNKNMSEKEGESSNEIHTISDKDESNIESDIDELHLLQKLYSESDSESPINLSDSENEAKSIRETMNDVISIEDSSYSECEDSNSNYKDIEDVKNNVPAESNGIEMSIESLCDKPDTDFVRKSGKSRVNLSVEVTREIQEILSNKENGDSENSKDFPESSIKGRGIVDKNIECDIPNSEVTQNVAACDENNQKKSRIYPSKTSDTTSLSEEAFEGKSQDVYDENKTKESPATHKSKIVEANTSKSQVVTENELAMLPGDSNDTIILATENLEKNKLPMSIETIESNSSEEDFAEKHLLASSDDETASCVNLGDDNISISDTCIGNIISVQKDASEIEAGPINIDCKKHVNGYEDNSKELTSSNESQSDEQDQQESHQNNKHLKIFKNIDKINTQEAHIIEDSNNSTDKSSLIVDTQTANIDQIT